MIAIIIGDHSIGSILVAKYYDTFGNEKEFTDIKWFGSNDVTKEFVELEQYQGKKQIQALKPIPIYIRIQIEDTISQNFIININEITPTFQNTLPTVGNGISLEIPVSTMSGLSSETNNVGRINQSLRLILNTAKGEFPMLPNFGCNLHNVIFQAIQNDSDLESIRQDLLEDLSRQEPRINIKDIQIGFDYVDTLTIVIEYQIYNTNITGNLIYNHKIGGEVNV